MADKQISELTAGTISSNNDVLMFDDATGVTYKLPYSDLARAILQTSLGAGAGISITQDTSASIFKMDIASTVEGSRWYYGTSQPQNAGNGDYWINTTSGQNLSVYQYNGSAWNDTGMDLKGTDGTNGINGQDGYSISATTTTITGGHRVTIHSTDPNVPDTYFDVMDGTGGGGGGVTKTLLFDNECDQFQITTITADTHLITGSYDEIEIEAIFFDNRSSGGSSNLCYPIHIVVRPDTFSELITDYLGIYNVGIVVEGIDDTYAYYEVTETLDVDDNPVTQFTYYAVSSNVPADMALNINRIWGVNY